MPVPGLARSILDRRTTARYLSRSGTRRLHLGCGTYHLDGWLNSDLEPASPADIRLDATRRFPLPDDSFDFVYSEHMIEHVPFPAGGAMLAECLRVLRPGGVLRVATPRLEFLIDLFRPARTETQERYLHWATECHTPWAPEASPVFVLNNFVRAWGHQFLYDERTLVEAMRRAGFEETRPERMGESRHEALRGLEHEERLPPGLLRLETMIVEGTKPG